MADFVCNIDKQDRINRVVIGAVLFLGALIGLGKVFMMLVGFILVLEGAMGWCGIPVIMQKWRDMQSKK